MRELDEFDGYSAPCNRNESAVAVSLTKTCAVRGHAPTPNTELRWANWGNRSTKNGIPLGFGGDVGETELPWMRISNGRFM